MTHNLIRAYDLLNNVTVIPPSAATIEELKSFHSEEYIEFLRKINDLTEEEALDEEEEELEKYGIGNCIILTIIKGLHGFHGFKKFNFFYCRINL